MNEQESPEEDPEDDNELARRHDNDRNGRKPGDGQIEDESALKA